MFRHEKQLGHIPATAHRGAQSAVGVADAAGRALAIAAMLGASKDE